MMIFFCFFYEGVYAKSIFGIKKIDKEKTAVIRQPII